MKYSVKLNQSSAMICKQNAFKTSYADKYYRNKPQKYRYTERKKNVF